MPVTQNITFSATPPTTGENPTTFNYNAISCWDDLKNNIVPALNTAFGQLNELETNVNAKEVSCVNSASSAASDALLAAGAANNKGAWGLLTGALNIPAAVNHLGSIWILNRNIANVALSEPTSTNTDWTESSGVTQQELDAVSAASVKTTTDQTIAGSKTFSSPIKLSNSGFTATLQSGTLSGDVVHTLPAESAELAPIASPAFTGTPTAPNFSYKPTPVTVTSWSYITTTITLNVVSHTFVAGDYIEVSGLTATTNIPNGVHLVTSVTSTTIVFTYALTPTGTTGVSSATVKGYMTTNGRVEGVGIGQTWRNMLMERMSGVTYTNNSGKPRHVCATAFHNSIGGTIAAYVDGLLLTQHTNGSPVTNFGHTSFIVPNASQYRIDVSTWALNSWVELS